MMCRPILFGIILSIGTTACFAQERLSNLSFNPDIYYSLNPQSPQARKKEAVLNYIYSEDTLLLPFFDDFSSNRTRKYEFTDDDVNPNILAAGSCFYEDVIEQQFMQDTSWRYIYVNDSTTDSVAKSMIRIFVYNDTGNCSTPTDTLELWPVYYHNIVFDSLGDSVSGTLVPYDTLFFVSEKKIVVDKKSYWSDNYVYINRTYPVKPVTVGVATFDGLDEYGMPYNYTPLSYGKADYLTSKIVSLKGLSPADSVYLSFYYQPEGIGDYPNEDDSLVVQFLDTSGRWVNMWATDGVELHDFKRVMIPVLNPAFLYGGFRFRFTNYATLSGNNDHWHIDYVYLNQGRSAQDTAADDRSIAEVPFTLLKDFYTIPWTHFDDTKLIDDIQITISNQSDKLLPVSTNYDYWLTETVSGDTISFNSPTTTLLPMDDSLVWFETSVTQNITVPAYTTDSIILRNTYLVDGGDAYPFKQNDTIPVDLKLSNYYAHDDGTAEKAYGLYSVGAKLAYQFTMIKTDTIRGISIHFAHMNADLSTDLFTIAIWDDNGGVPGQLQYEKFFQSPEYISQRNGFYTYIIDAPFVITPGKYYIGTIQTTTEVLNIGFDMNNNGKPYTFFDVGSGWTQTQFNGALMMRPIVGKKLIMGTDPALQESTAGEITVYPNPARDNIYVSGSIFSGKYNAAVYDYIGKLVKEDVIEQGAPISVRELPIGFYIIQLTDMAHNNVTFHKFIRQE